MAVLLQVIHAFHLQSMPPGAFANVDDLKKHFRSSTLAKAPGGFQLVGNAPEGILRSSTLAKAPFTCKASPVSSSSLLSSLGLSLSLRMDSRTQTTETGADPQGWDGHPKAKAQG